MGNAASSQEISARALDALAKEAAKNCALVAVKSEKGGFVLVDLRTRQTIAGDLMPRRHFKDLQ